MPQQEEYRFCEKRLAGLNPIGYGQQRCPAGFSVSVPRPYWMLHFVISGKGTFSTGNMTYNVGPSQIFIAHPHQTHTYKADLKEPWHYVWVLFDSEIQMPEILGTDVFAAPTAGKIFSEILETTGLEAGKEEYLAGKIWELMSLLIRLERGKQIRINPYVTKAKQYIEQNYMHGIKVTDIAKELNLDRSYFSTVFKRQTGISPQQYLSEFRLEQAAKMLVTDGGSVAAAAYLAGYNDIVNFSRMFKKHFGTAPSHYREMILAHEQKLQTPNIISFSDNLKH